MDLNQATQAHAEWKVKLRVAINKREKLDVTTISADNCCQLGKWLHGEARGLFGTLATYQECVKRHAEFHRAAGEVAQTINRGEYDAAGKLLDGGTRYSAASSAVASAILGLKKEAKL